jgi:Arc/MetJ family transcription regulator
MSNVDEVYSFVFRGLLTEDALDANGRLNHLGSNKLVDDEIVKRLSIELLDKDMVARALRMAAVYTAIASFENSVRRLVSTVLLEQVGAEWWQTSVPNKVRERAESRQAEEVKVRWHTPRGDEPLNYTEFGDLIAIINQNWDRFEPFIRSLEWARQLTATIERSRNVIMHSGELELEDIERIGGLIRDWVKQVGV